MPHLGLVAFYTGLVIATCLFAVRFGGWPEQAGAVILASGSFLTAAFSYGFGTSFRHVETGILIVDMLGFLAFFWVALTCNRYWPLWATAFQSIAVLTHLAVYFDRSIVPAAYAAGQGLWAYPMLAALLLGSERYRRSRGQTPPTAFRF